MNNLFLNVAQHIHTGLEWSDLVLDNITTEKVMQLNSRLYTLSLNKEIKHGLCTLFYGPAGTGKKLTATLLGKNAGLEVYTINVSKMISNYIGETEKNLTNIFDLAKDKNWLLFFDEAEALFEKRTEVKNSHDRYSNTEIDFLIHRIENFSGIVILSSNLKSNIDESFIRRFHNSIQFLMPNVAERLKLWQNSFLDKSKLSADIKFEDIAQKYGLSGGTIINIARFCYLTALKDQRNIMLVDIMDGIRREANKNE